MVGVEVKLGDKVFMLEQKMYKKVMLLCKRVMQDHPKQDSTLGINGRTGTGKTNLAVIIAGLASQQTGRTINLFFSSAATLEFAQRTENQLIILDEPSLDMLARDWASQTAKNFLRLTNTMRRKRHFFIINLVNFWHFPQDLVVDRLNGLCHMYLKSNGSPGKFLYIRQKKLESLWNDYKKLNKRRFFHYKSFRGDIPYVMEDGTFEKLNISVDNKPNATYNDYEMLKDKAIASINKQDVKKDKTMIKLLTLRQKIGKADFSKLGLTKVQMAHLLGITVNDFAKWSRIDLDNPEIEENEQIEANSLGKEGFGAPPPSPFIISRDKEEEIIQDDIEEEDKPDENDEDEL